MWPEKKVKRILALALIGVGTVILAFALKPYLNAFLGALILFVLFNPFYERLTKRMKLPKSLSALAVIIISLVAFLVPFTILLSIIIQEAQDILPQLGNWLSHNSAIMQLWNKWAPQFDLSGQLASAGPTIKSLFFGTVSAVSSTVISWVVMSFILYFLLVTENTRIMDGIYSLVPFSRDNTMRLAREFRNITRTTLVTSGLIAVMQGSLLTLTFIVFGLPGAFLWGFVGCLMSFVPVIGVTAVWIPATIFVMMGGHIWLAIGVMACGLFISTIDNFVRPLIQRKVGQIHPLVSLLGIFVGLSLFGLIGIVIGPLMLTYFILSVQMFREEYIK